MGMAVQREGRIGLRSGAGFLDDSGLGIDPCRERRLAALIDLLRHVGLRDRRCFETSPRSRGGVPHAIDALRIPRH